MSDPQVSVIIPAFNAAEYLERTVQSVLDQSFQDWELVLVDDASTDATRELMARLEAQDARIRPVFLEQNCGMPARPRNMGIAHAGGEWIAFLDADDIWHPRKLELQLRALKDTGAEFCSTQMQDFSLEQDIQFADIGPFRLETVTFQRQLRRYRTPTSSVIVRRSWLLRYPFNEDPRYRAREDLDLWLRLHEHMGSSIKLACPLMFYRQVPGQISGAKWQMLKRTLWVLQQYRLRGGAGLGWHSYRYTLLHLLYSVYFRILRKSL